jgi:hypothetical protein
MPTVAPSATPSVTPRATSHVPASVAPSAPNGVPSVVPEGLVPIESPLALFVPDTRLHSMQPLALYLPALLPGAIVSGNYERTADGTILREEDRFLRHSLLVGGTRVEVSVDASAEDGLPTMFDWDILLGIFALVEQGAADERGVFGSLSLSAVCQAAGRHPNADGLAATKRALRRFAGVRIRTHLAVEPPADVAAPNAAGVYRSRAGALPTLVQSEGMYWVLEAQLTTETYREASGTVVVRETLSRLHLNPLWLAHARSGYTAWMNAELHWALQRAVSKRLLQVGSLAVARGEWRAGEPWELPLSTVAQVLGISAPRPARQLESVQAACQELAAHDALRFEIVPKEGRRREARVRLDLGPALHSASFYRTVAPSDPPGLRALLWHLGVFGIRDQDARAWLREDAAGVRDALRYAYWLQAEHGGRTSPTGREPVRNWAAFLRKAITERWAFEPEYQAWVRDVAAGRRPIASLPAPLEAILGIASTSTSTSTSNGPGAGGSAHADQRSAAAGRSAAGRPPLESAVPAPTRPPVPIVWPDDVWGHAAARVAAEDPAVAGLWLEGSTLVREHGDDVVVMARDAFAAQWIAQRLKARLETLLGELRGTPTALTVESPSADETSA